MASQDDLLATARLADAELVRFAEAADNWCDSSVHPGVSGSFDHLADSNRPDIAVRFGERKQRGRCDVFTEFDGGVVVEDVLYELSHSEKAVIVLRESEQVSACHA